MYELYLSDITYNGIIDFVKMHSMYVFLKHIGHVTNL